MVIHPGSQNNVIEILNLQPWENSMAQPPRPVIAAEVKTEGILPSWRSRVWVVAPANIVAALHAQTGVGLKRLACVGINQFH